MNYWLQEEKRKSKFEHFLKEFENTDFYDNMSILLENQDFQDQRRLDSTEPLMNSLSIVKNVFDPKFFVVSELVSIQPLMQAADDIKYEKLGPSSNEIEVIEKRILARTRRLKTLYSTSSEKVVDIVALSNKITDEISSEIMCDLSNNVGTIVTAKACGIGNRVNSMFDIIRVKTGLPCNNYWVAASLNVLQRFDKFMSPSIRMDKFNLYKYGKIGLTNLYCCNSLNNNEIIVGMKRPKYSGYVYSPYCPLIPVRFFDPINGKLRTVILTRYGKNLTRTGARHYAKIIIEE